MADGVTWIKDAAKKAVDRVNRAPGRAYAYPADVDLYFDFVNETWVARVNDFYGRDKESPVQAFNNVGTP
jgi:hypothetical protein